MATLVLQAAGAAVGALFGPVGAIAGRALGALAGYAVDSALFGQSTTREVCGSPTSSRRPRARAPRSRASMAACAFPAR